MPKIKDEHDAKLALLNNFKDLAQWQHNKNGNLVRYWEGQRLTIFRRYDSYRWCIANSAGGDPEYSNERFETEEDALDDLAAQVLML
jgi:hypothetical protein